MFCLTPELSGRARPRTTMRVVDRSRQFIHGRSARTKVRTINRSHSAISVEGTDWSKVPPRQNAPPTSAAQPHRSPPSTLAPTLQRLLPHPGRRWHRPSRPSTDNWAPAILQLCLTLDTGTRFVSCRATTCGRRDSKLPPSASTHYLTNISAAEVARRKAAFSTDLHVDPEVRDCIY
jgi:hypothetical protein